LSGRNWWREKMVDFGLLFFRLGLAIRVGVYYTALREIGHCSGFLPLFRYLYFPKFKLVDMRKIRAFQGWFIIMRVRLFGQNRIKIGGKKRKTANSGGIYLAYFNKVLERAEI